MSYQDLLEWCEARPFEPFRLVMSDGGHFDIVSPRLIWPGLSSVMVGLPVDPQLPDAPGRHVTVAMPHVVRIEPLPAAAAG